MFARIWKNGSSLVVLDPEYVGSEWLHCQAKSISNICDGDEENNNGSSEETSRNNRGNNELNLPNTASHYSNSSTIQEIDLNNKHIYENKDENVDSFLNLPKQQHDNSSLQEVPL
ncbi:15294_t:CDS:2 [Entrophospora sp. SA101]|nr:15294_t:CDS:2 [Entrophospora sp. SA101]